MGGHEESGGAQPGDYVLMKREETQAETWVTWRAEMQHQAVGG